MQIPNIVSLLRKATCVDVAKSQPHNLDKLMCYSTPEQAIVSKGRTQAAVTSQRGQGPETTGLPKPRDYRSRGWHRALKQSWHFAQLRSSQPAHHKCRKKLSTLKTRQDLFPLNLFTQASTSKTSGRACVVSHAVPALFLRANLIGGAA